MSINNQVQFIGHLGSDPEIRLLTSGKKVASFRLATNEVYKDKQTGEKKTVTDWHNITAFSPLAELIEKYVKKGSELAVVGRHKSESYEDKEKVKRYRSHFIISELKFLGKPKDVSSEAPTILQGEVTTEEDDDLPF